ncbi:MAG TPA: YicC/YloC family endoribonuclease [Polyangiaceae bacterium]|nr:YicC/YloC family endoribonuclease [Polyangiaceae bacterium]
MRSMTGFGIGEATLGEGRVTLELRGLNHRFLDVRVRLPPEWAEHGFFVEQLARERLARGRFDIGVRLAGASLPSARFSADKARAVYAALLELRDAVAPGSEVPLSSVLMVPALVSSPPEEDLSPRDALQGALDMAVRHFDQMRLREGEALRRDLFERLAQCRALVAQIRERSGLLPELYRNRLRERADQLLSGCSLRVEPARLELEIALFADKVDICEELARLGSHFDQFEELAVGSQNSGRRLDFLLQEIGREANTVGGKCQDAAIAHLVVELKAQIERMREQVQNVE